MKIFNLKPFNIKSKLLYLLLAFIGLFLIRLLYGYLVYPNNTSAINTSHVTANSFTLERKNYASKKMSYKQAATKQATTSVDQKYEKVGALTNLTDHYKEDESKLYALINQQHLMIQLEQKSGLASSRRLNIALGVVPDKFDVTIKQLRTIGTVRHIQIDKKDKTNEYNKLEAKRVSLQKARQTLLDLKQTQGDVGDMIGLVNRLLEVENQIQSLGVSLGEFDSQNEFCTVKFTLREVGKASPIRISHRIKVALVWAIEVYLAFWSIIILGLLGIYLFLIVWGVGKEHKNIWK